MLLKCYESHKIINLPWSNAKEEDTSGITCTKSVAMSIKNRKKNHKFVHLVCLYHAFLISVELKTTHILNNTLLSS